MENHIPPTDIELPTRTQLRRPTVFALLAAVLIAVTVVLPAEYGIDPTGVGRPLGLTDMGEIKAQLAREAEADRRMDRERQAPAQEKRSNWLGRAVAGFFIQSAAAQTASPTRTDEMSVTLRPNEGAEIKLEMKKGQKARYNWKATGGAVNYDLHGEADASPDKAHSYKKGRATEADSGTLEAAFDGTHGWFWRNRTGKPVTVTVRAEGEYRVMKRM